MISATDNYLSYITGVGRPPNLHIGTVDQWEKINNFGSSLKVFGNPQQSSKFSEKVVWPSEEFWKIFANPRKVVGKSSENHQQRRHQYVYITKRTLHVSSKIWILCFRGKNNSCHSNIKAISSRHCVISFIYVTTLLKFSLTIPVSNKKHDHDAMED